VIGKFMNPWIDRRVVHVRSTAAADYLRRHGWESVAGANANYQLFAGPVAASGQRVTQPVPLFEDTGEYVQRIIELITNVAILEDRPAVEVLEEMLGVTTPSGNGVAHGKPVGEPTPAPAA
jgi:hypothetical protein